MEVWIEEYRKKGRKALSLMMATQPEEVCEKVGRELGKEGFRISKAEEWLLDNVKEVPAVLVGYFAFLRGVRSGNKSKHRE